MVDRGDEEWLSLVRWVLFALLIAEEKGVTQANVRTLATTTQDTWMRNLLGRSGGFGKFLGVGDDWVVRAVTAVGNYGEMFERNLGRQSPLKLDRGLNRLWSDGGLMYAPPLR